MHILVVRTNSPFWDEALCFAQQLGGPNDGRYVVLSVAADAEEAYEMRQSLAAGLPAGRLKVRQGNFYHQVLEEIAQDTYDLILLGADVEGPGELHHRPTAEYIAQQSEVPVGIVRSCPESWDRILICARAPDPALPVSRRGTELAAQLDAIPTILHVMRPPPQGEPSAVDLPLGLADGLLKIRHGPVRDEISAEISSGDYQIAVIGAHALIPAKGIDNLTLAQPDIMRQVLDLQLPVVVVVGQQPAIAATQTKVSALTPHPLWRMIGYVVAELAVYGALVVAYAMVAFRFLVDRLNDWFHNNPALYAGMALLLIVGQGILLEELTSFLLDRLRLERFE